MSQKLDKLNETIITQNKAIVDILAEHKVLINQLLKQNEAIDNIVNIFPINSEDDLKALDMSLSKNAAPYVS